jgi:hypothetical protein
MEYLQEMVHSIAATYIGERCSPNGKKKKAFQ